MEALTVGLLLLILSTIIHLEWVVSSLKTVVTQLKKDADAKDKANKPGPGPGIADIITFEGGCNDS